MNYKVYVRGHGGEEGKPLPPAEDLPIYMITVGQFGSTMSDEVADAYIYRHVGYERIRHDIENEVIIYWTKEQRDEYYRTRRLEFSNPAMTITAYEAIRHNLALEGDSGIGDCGVCYWNEGKGELEWIVRLEDRQTIYLSQILEILKGMLSHGDAIELYWTACMSAEYWSGKNKKVSFNPTKK